MYSMPAGKNRAKGKAKFIYVHFRKYAYFPDGEQRVILYYELTIPLGVLYVLFWRWTWMVCTFFLSFIILFRLADIP